MVLVGTFLAPATQVLLLFATAGTVNVPRAWLYLVVGLIGIFGGTVLVARAPTQSSGTPAILGRVSGLSARH
jgi:hypothetical protein